MKIEAGKRLKTMHSPVWCILLRYEDENTLRLLEEEPSGLPTAEGQFFAHFSTVTEVDPAPAKKLLLSEGPAFDPIKGE